MEVVPHVGIGNIRLGMSREEADWLRDNTIQVDSAGSPPVVTFVQASWRSGATYRGLGLFDASAVAVIAALVELEGLNPADYPPGKHTYQFPTLNLVLWRGHVSDDNPNDRQGYYFQCVSVHAPGYYDRAAR